MGKPSVKELANSFIGAAERDPENRPKIFRKAAQVFAGLASDPQNQHMSKRLTAIGLDFAGAAQAAFQAATTSDFTQLLKDTSQAWEELDPNTPFTHQAMDMISNARGIASGSGGSGVPGTVSGVPSMSIAPSTFNNKDATLGRQVTVKFAPTQEEISIGVQQSQTAAFWQGQKQEAQAMTVDIGVVIPAFVPAGVGAAFDIRPYAIVEYGSDGTKSNATLDVGLGRRFTVVGNYISVIVGMDPPGFGLNSNTMTIGASVGAFAAPSQAPVLRTAYFDGLVAGIPSSIMTIPNKAVQLLTPTGAGPKGGPIGVISITFVDTAGTPLSTVNYDSSALGTQPPLEVPIPGDAFYYIVKTASNGNVRIIFQLAL